MSRAVKSSFGRILFSIVGHLLGLAAVLASFIPAARYYYQSYPPFGADFYQFVNFASHLKKHSGWILFSWKPTWFSGHPTLFDYGLIHSYLIVPLMSSFSVANASEIYLLFTLALYLVFAYFLFWELSKNHLVALLLAVYMAWTPNFYTSLFGGGTNGFTATQMFLPLVFFLVVKYLKGQSKKFLILGSLALGLSFWGHAGLALALITVPILIILFFWNDGKTSFISGRKVKDMLLFFIPAFLLAGFALYPVIYPILYWAGETMSGYVGLSTRPYPTALLEFLTSNNYFLFASLLGSFIAIITTRRFKKLKESIAFVVLSFYFLIFEFLFVIGHNPLGNAIGPDRTYFAFTLALACLLATFWQVMGQRASVSFSKFTEMEAKERISLYLQVTVFAILAVGLFSSFYYEDYLKIRRSYAASVPTVINETLVYDNPNIIQQILPSWLDTKETNYRIYESDNAVNTWWNILFDLPMVKGCYYTGTSQFTANWLYWADLSFIGEIVRHFNTPEPVAKNSALFLLDWYAVKYFDNHPDPYGLASYLVSEPGLVKRRVDEKGQLEFIEIGDEFTSPIVRPVNSPNILVVGNDPSYDVILRILGMENLNSKYLIPIHGPEYLDEIKKDELSNFDAIFLYNYRYKNHKVWNFLEDYVKNGGNLIIETGTEVKESDIENTPKFPQLPDVFPVKKTTRKELGTDWSLERGEKELLADVGLKDFSSLIYNDAAWKLSYAEAEDVRDWGKVVLSQRGKPILVSGSLGQGKVVWSGMNLPYHIQTYLNFEESQLFRNLIRGLVGVKNDDLKDYQIERPEPENIKVTGNNFSGVLLKENNFKGWKASTKEEKLKIYDAGLDFIYVRVPQGTTQVSLNFRGATISWFLFILSFLTLGFYFAYVIFGGKIFKKITKIIPTFGLNKKISQWWLKDDDE